MLWNWYTVDACFLSTTWHVTSNGMFAGSCIGVMALVLLLEFLRRLQREYDRSIQPQHALDDTTTTTAVRVSSIAKGQGHGSPKTNGSDFIEEIPHPALPLQGNWRQSLPLRIRYVPTVPQQALRALIHTMQFSVAYIIMLLAMYYNGYIIVCIFIGVFIGFFVFARDATGATSM